MFSKCTDTTQSYVGITANAFKSRYIAHKSSFSSRHLGHSTSLSEYIWDLTAENTNFKTNHHVGIGVPQAFHDCVFSSNAMCARVGSPVNQSVADNTSNGFNIISASVSISISDSVKGAPNNGSVSSAVVNNEIVGNTPFADSSPVRPGATITRSGRVF